MGWQEKLTSSGRSLWEELVYRYSRGVDDVGVMREAWASVEGRIDAKRFADVAGFLQTQHYEARWWRDACQGKQRQDDALGHGGLEGREPLHDAHDDVEHERRYGE